MNSRTLPAGTGGPTNIPQATSSRSGRPRITVVLTLALLVFFLTDATARAANSITNATCRPTL